MSQTQTRTSTRRLAKTVGWEVILGVLLVITTLGGALSNKAFLTAENWANLLANFVEIALMALPLCLIVITKEIDPQLAHEFGKLPRLTYGVVEIPAFTAPSQTTAYYQAGSPEAGRPGSYFVNTYNLKARPKWEMEALSLHESVPGHHLQIALAQEQEGVPEFRKHSGYTAFVEGWGLYAESLGPELGMYKDPYSKFGQLTYEMWRAVRLVVDTGMHAMGWTRQQAIDFFRENTSKTDQDITVEVDRYIVWPGQALAYKIGQMKIRELRTEAEKELGSKFNVRTFHDAVLEQGAVPLDLLQAHVEEWMKEQSGRLEK